MSGIFGLVGSESGHTARACLERMHGGMFRATNLKACMVELPVRLPDGPGHLWAASTSLNAPDQTCAIDNGDALVFSGHLYNLAELRSWLSADANCTPAQLMLETWRRDPEGYAHRWRGPFAVAIWNSRAKTLILSRGRLGKEPLYVTQHPRGAGRRIAFASETRALLSADVVERKLNPVAVEVLLFNGHLVSPVTMLADVNSIIPGHQLSFDVDTGTARSRAYWLGPRRPEGPTRLSQSTIQDNMARLRTRFESVVSDALHASEKPGVLLSSGLDSSSLAALSARLRPDTRTITVAFEERDYDESHRATLFAQRLGTPHTVTYVTRADLAANLDNVIDAMDQPTYDGFNVFFAARAAREHGVTSIISGLGGDELFGGYPESRFGPWLAKVDRLAEWISPLERLAAFVTSRRRFDSAGPVKLAEMLHHHSSGMSQRNLLAAFQSIYVMLPVWTRRALAPVAFANSGDQTYCGLPIPFVEYCDEVNAGGPDSLEALQRIGSVVTLAERTVRDLRAIASANGMAVHIPMTDHSFIDEAWKTPASIRGSRTLHKQFQFEMIKPYVGDEFADPGKQGFVIPFAEWIRHPALLNTLEQVFTDARLARSIGLEPAVLSSFLHDFVNHRAPMIWDSVWTVYVLLRWCQKNEVSL
jgi:asparagine synthase (glutamine-hydrolysing)